MKNDILQASCFRADFARFVLAELVSFVDRDA